MKQRVVDNFDGDTLDERWAEVNQLGTGTFAMADAVDEGFQITCDAGSGTKHSYITFGGIAHYSKTGSKMICVARRTTDTNNFGRYGLRDSTTSDNNSCYCQERDTASGSGEYTLRTGDNTGNSDSDSGVASRTSFTKVEVEQLSASAQLSLDNLLYITKTTDMSTLDFQPTIGVLKLPPTGGEIMQIRYCEIYNT